MLDEVRTSYSEPLYTLTEAEQIIDLQRARSARHKVAMRTYYLVQRACGLVFVIIGCLLPLFDRTTGMESIICVLIGIGLITTRQMVMMFWR